jgi:CheY-like chemotaxis protein
MAIDGFKERLEKGLPLPQLIILDLNMPVMDGWEFLHAFVELNVEEEITIYMVTSSIDDNDRRKALQYEKISGFVIKPITSQMFQKLFEDPET